MKLESEVDTCKLNSCAENKLNKWVATTVTCSRLRLGYWSRKNIETREGAADTVQDIIG